MMVYGKLHRSATACTLVLYGYLWPFSRKMPNPTFIIINIQKSRTFELNTKSNVLRQRDIIAMSNFKPSAREATAPPPSGKTKKKFGGMFTYISFFSLFSIGHFIK